MIVALGRQAVESASMQQFATKSMRRRGAVVSGFNVQCKVAKSASVDAPLGFPGRPAGAFTAARSIA